ncbi:hypothetical protein MPF_0371 [Methanohalophilus portucalensis FDF-1]|uniref:Uncharacterized protein n=1 Tax=Methanohalophilus portucalensis FDF-1 TaxID=523843 RepID=A0A1L9C517_9EURY|nr:hypothetical protein MPF_0371 [Methanohalophilus portucalensis FDF-1]
MIGKNLHIGGAQVFTRDDYIGVHIVTEDPCFTFNHFVQSSHLLRDTSYLLFVDSELCMIRY